MSAPYDVSSLFRVDSLVVVVTGGGTGLGLIVANALDQNGAKAVYIVGRREDKLKAAAAQAVNGTLIPVVGDVNDAESLRALADRVRKDHGYVNAIVANAGISGFSHDQLYAGLLPGPRSDTKPTPKDFVEGFLSAGMAAFTEVLHTNTTGVFFTCLAFLDLLIAGNEKGNVFQKSQVLVTTSAAAFARSHPGPSYCASKAATTSLCKQLATFFGPYTVRVNNMAPGFFPSDMSDPAAQAFVGPNGDATKEGSIAKSLIPLERFGTKEEMAGQVLFLLSRAGGYINGDVLLCDGGILSQLPASF